MWTEKELKEEIILFHIHPEQRVGQVDDTPACHHEHQQGYWDHSAAVKGQTNPTEPRPSLPPPARLPFHPRRQLRLNTIEAAIKRRHVAFNTQKDSVVFLLSTVNGEQRQTAGSVFFVVLTWTSNYRYRHQAAAQRITVFIRCKKKTSLKSIVSAYTWKNNYFFFLQKI